MFQAETSETLQMSAAILNNVHVLELGYYCLIIVLCFQLKQRS